MNTNAKNNARPTLSAVLVPAARLRSRSCRQLFQVRMVWALSICCFNGLPPGDVNIAETMSDVFVPLGRTTPVWARDSDWP